MIDSFEKIDDIENEDSGVHRSIAGYWIVIREIKKLSDFSLTILLMDLSINAKYRA